MPGQDHGFARVAAWFVCLLALAIGEVGAQGLVPPPPGSLGRFHPTYASTYDVLRDRKVWDQSLSITHALDSLVVNSSVTSKMTEDVRQNDLDIAEAGTSHALTFPVFRGARMGVSANLNRSNQTSTTSDILGRNEQYQFTADYARMLSKWLRFALGGRGGSAHVFSETDRTLAGQLNRSSTDQNGPSVTFNGRLARESTKPGDVTSSIAFTRTSFNQETEARERTFASDLSTVVVDSTLRLKANNIDQNIQAATAWQRGKWLTSDFHVSRTTSNKVTPLPTRGGIDVTELRGDQLGALVKLTPRAGQVLSLSYDASSDRSRSREQEGSNRDGSSSDLRANAEFDAFGCDGLLTYHDFSSEASYTPLLGNETTAFPDLERSLKELKSKVSRNLGRKIVLALRSEISLAQDFYGDGFQDKDVQEKFNDVTIGYKPSFLSADLSLTDRRTRTVYVDPRQAQNTQTTEDLTVRASYRFEGRRWFSASQTITIQAVSREFDFTLEDQADRSDLTRNNRVLTTLVCKLMPKAPIVLEHSYNFRNLGSYADDDENGVREFTLASEFIEQQLAVSTHYDLAQGLSVSGRQVLKQTVNRSPGGSGTRSPRYDLELAARFNRVLLGAVNTDVDASRILSTREDRYWKIRATVTRTF